MGINGRAPEWVGPEEMQEDVANVPERKLVLRAIHEVLCLRQEFGGIVGEVGELAGAVKDLLRQFRRTSAFVDTIERRLSATQDEVRNGAARPPTMADIVAAAREEAEVTASHVLRDDKLAAYTQTEQRVQSLKYGIIGTVVAGIILAVLTFAAGRLTH